MRTAADNALPSRNPFTYLWLGTGVLLNITGLASVAADAVKWIEFFANIWTTYRLWVREPIFQLLMVIWPYWLPPIPRVCADLLVIWSGIWIAITIYHYQVSGKLKLAEVFESTRADVSERVFFRSGLYWMLVEAFAVIRAALDVLYCYVTLPPLYVYYAVFGGAPLRRTLDRAYDHLARLENDLAKVGTLIEFRYNLATPDIVAIDRNFQLETRSLPADVRKVFADRIARRKRSEALPDKDALDLETKTLNALNTFRERIICDKAKLEKAIDVQYLILASRQVIIYYGCIVAFFLAVLFVNYTALHLGAS